MLQQTESLGTVQNGSCLVSPIPSQGPSNRGRCLTGMFTAPCRFRVGRKLTSPEETGQHVRNEFPPPQHIRENNPGLRTGEPLPSLFSLFGQAIPPLPECLSKEQEHFHTPKAVSFTEGAKPLFPSPRFHPQREH